MKTPSIQRVRAAKDKALKVFSQFAEVVGVGITMIGASLALKVNLAKPPAEGLEDLPKNVDGIPVQVEVVGKIRKRASQ